jgi:predicted ATPase
MTMPRVASSASLWGPRIVWSEQTNERLPISARGPSSRYSVPSMTGLIEHSAAIRTPDQRLRVFVSSTLQELAEERAAVSRAVSALRLTPVMFELGARPHPPRELYRAYLAQSDIFIGLYWQRYGWVGPGMDISGLEDEFELSRSLPRLLYVKTPAPDREPRLAELLERVQREATESYRSFRTARELGRLVRDDLAVMLSEVFAAAGQAASTASGSGRRLPRSLPATSTSLIGRDEAIEEVRRLIERPETRLVTLTGPGGIGKTRLAIAAVERVGDRYPPGPVYVPLASVAKPDLLLANIASAVGADLARSRSPLDALVEQFGDTPVLLVLDSMERVVAAAPDLDELLARCPGVRILATSRTALRLRAENEYPVSALSLPSAPRDLTTEQLASSPAIELFVDRARAVRPDFALTEENAQAVAEICRRLEGLPLAIELAAARTRLLEPAALLARFESSLDALGTGPVDLPERQRTLRATVDWSVGLLDEAERSMLSTLAVFIDGWTIEAAAHVGDVDGDRALDLLEALATQSLVQVDASTSAPRFRMLETIREFIADQPETSTRFAAAQRRHAEYFRDLAERADRPLRSWRQVEWAERLQVEAGNLGAAIRWYLAHDIEPVPRLVRVLWLFWQMRDQLLEVRLWTEEVIPAAASLEKHAQAELFWSAAVMSVQLGDDDGALAAKERLEPLLDAVDDPFLEAVAHLAIVWILPIVDDFDGALREAVLSHEQLLNQDEPFWEAVALSTLGQLEMAVGHLDDALPHLTHARELSEQFDNAWLSVSWSQLANLAIMQARLDDARALLDVGLSLSLEAESTVGVTQCLAAFARLAFASGAPDQAAATLGAAEGLRRRIGVQAWPALRRGEAELGEQIEHALGRDRFDEALATGARLSRPEAVAIVRGQATR